MGPHLLSHFVFFFSFNSSTFSTRDALRVGFFSLFEPISVRQIISAIGVGILVLGGTHVSLLERLKGGLNRVCFWRCGEPRIRWQMNDPFSCGLGIQR